MAALTKVGYVGKQPTSLDGGLGSVSRISMATQITPGSRKKCHATSKSILKVSSVWRTMDSIVLQIQDGALKNRTNQEPN